MNFQAGEFKKAVFSSAILKYRQSIGDLTARLKSVVSAKENSGSAYIQTKPPRIETIEEISLLSNQLQMGNHEFEVLRKMQSFIDHIHTFVELASVVTTNRGIYFVAPNVDQFSVDGKKIFGVTVHSSFYYAMKGKREGECFHYLGLAYAIKEIA